jgi:hypothetical protein
MRVRDSCAAERADRIVDAVIKAAEAGEWRAAWLYERVYGKPTERAEVDTPGSLGDIAAMSTEERRALRRRLLAEYPELCELVPRDERRRLDGRA